MSNFGRRMLACLIFCVCNLCSGLFLRSCTTIDRAKDGAKLVRAQLPEHLLLLFHVLAVLV